MKISIRKKDNVFKRITVYLPLSIIKSRILWNIIVNYASGEEKENLKSIQFLVLECYKVLKKYVRENKHFNLVEVNNKDFKIVIRI